MPFSEHVSPCYRYVLTSTSKLGSRGKGTPRQLVPEPVLACDLEATICPKLFIRDSDGCAQKMISLYTTQEMRARTSVLRVCMEDSVSPYNVPLDRGGIGGSDRESSKTCGSDCGVSMFG